MGDERGQIVRQRHASNHRREALALAHIINEAQRKEAAQQTGQDNRLRCIEVCVNNVHYNHPLWLLRGRKRLDLLAQRSDLVIQRLGLGIRSIGAVFEDDVTQSAGYDVESLQKGDLAK